MPYCGGVFNQIFITPNQTPNQNNKNPSYMTYEGFYVASVRIELAS